MKNSILLIGVLVCTLVLSQVAFSQQQEGNEFKEVRILLTAAQLRALGFKGTEKGVSLDQLFRSEIESCVSSTKEITDETGVNCLQIVLLKKGLPSNNYFAQEKTHDNLIVFITINKNIETIAQLALTLIDVYKNDSANTYAKNITYKTLDLIKALLQERSEKVEWNKDITQEEAKAINELIKKIESATSFTENACGAVKSWFK
jgi:hypothetical protein